MAENRFKKNFIVDFVSSSTPIHMDKRCIELSHLNCLFLIGKKRKKIKALQRVIKLEQKCLSCNERHTEEQNCKETGSGFFFFRR